MGFFSFMTADTNRSINNCYSGKGVFPVYVIQPKGLPVILEESYDGYGDFGSRDIFALILAWNAPQLVVGNDSVDRDLGHAIFYKLAINGEIIPMKYPPKFSEDPNRSYDSLPPSIESNDQGFFWDEEEDELEL
jgi:hypothetical protein